MGRADAGKRHAKPIKDVTQAGPGLCARLKRYILSTQAPRWTWVCHRVARRVVMGRCLVVTFMLSALAGSAIAQTSGEITGEVRDQSGAVAPNAAVTATNTATNVARSTVTNASGVYSFPN